MLRHKIGSNCSIISQMSRSGLLSYKLKISITFKSIYLFLEKLHIGLGIFLGYLIFKFKPWDGFRIFLCSLLSLRVESPKVLAANSLFNRYVRLRAF